MTVESDDTEVISGSGDQVVTVGEQFQCQAPGFYEFEADCIHFYRCVFLDSGELTTLLYRCPERYVYSPERERCAPAAQAQSCAKDATTLLSLRAPPSPEDVRVLSEDDLDWFFAQGEKQVYRFRPGVAAGRPHLRATGGYREMNGYRRARGLF
ncbi:uncharacterized protein LOC119113994 [Pollicipes pollicipes]|nr:uncharacterized protein LOC119113994 [Pollicipes pollicipes]